MADGILSSLTKNIGFVSRRRLEEMRVELAKTAAAADRERMAKEAAQAEMAEVRKIIKNDMAFNRLQSQKLLTGPIRTVEMMERTLAAHAQTEEHLMKLVDRAPGFRGPKGKLVNRETAEQMLAITHEPNNEAE